jgi:hypothetical protein
MKKEHKKKLLAVLALFIIDGKPASEALAEFQIEIIYNIVYRPHKRLHIMCSTQTGKSLAVAIACIILTAIIGERVCVVAPTNDKYKIIMRYYRDHLKDNEMWVAQLEKESKLDRLIMEDTAKRITLKNGGAMYGISAQAGNSSKGIESAMGEGAKNVILDEAALIPDLIESTVFRMIAGQGESGFYCKIGNPFYRNHFLKSYNDPAYFKIEIDYKRALKDGRYTPLFISEAKRKPLFSILFENKFPGEEMYDEGMWLNLLPQSRITVRHPVGIPFINQRILGIDPAGEGKDISAFCIRDAFQAQIVAKLLQSNAKLTTQTGLTLVEKYKPIIDRDIVVDAFGQGTDVGKEFALATKGKMDIYTVLLGNKPIDEERYNKRFFRRRPIEVTINDEIHTDKEDIYMNLRAVAYFRMRDWIMAGGVIIDEDGDNPPWKEEIASIKYRRSLQGNVIQIMSKKERAERGLPSPNMADALALTFLREIETNPQSKEEIEALEEAERNQDFDRFSSV